MSWSIINVNLVVAILHRRSFSCTVIPRPEPVHNGLTDHPRPIITKTCEIVSQPAYQGSFTASFYNSNVTNQLSASRVRNPRILKK